MNRKAATGSGRSPWRRRPRLFQDLPLFAEQPVLPPQPLELFALIAAEPWPLADIDLVLADPVARRLLGHAEI
jgi:hypothetical protein